MELNKNKMRNINKQSQLVLGNIAMREGRLDDALDHYAQALRDVPELEKIINNNISLVRNRFKASSSIPRQNHQSLNIQLNDNDLVKLVRSSLDGKPKRFFNEFDTKLESTFLRDIKKIYDEKANLIKVTVIMPTFNRGDLIGKAIDSVLNQSHKNIELLIIDDGSTDTTASTLKRYTENYNFIRSYKNKKKGVSSARNLGLVNATGDFIFYLDSDNTWTTSFVKNMITLCLLADAKCGYSGISVVNDEGIATGYRGEPFDWKFCLEGNYVDLNAFCHHKSLYQQLGGFDESLKRMVDWDLILRFTKTNQPFYAPFIGCLYLDSKKDNIRISNSAPHAYRSIVVAKNKLTNPSPADLAANVSLKFAIKIAAPYEKRESWGDYHYADSLRQSLIKLGHQARIDFHGTWYDKPASENQVSIVLRGLDSYKPEPGQVNILWNISHPDQLSYSELEQYDLVFMASLSYPVLLNTFIDKPSIPLLQCTDLSRFSKGLSTLKANDKFLFVGNSRNEYRPIVKQVIDENLDLDVYGNNWKKFIPESYIKGENVSNTELGQYYHSYKYILNDHWQSMKDFGFVSNRVFDVLSSGGNLISDVVPSINRIFGNAVIEYEFGQNLVSKIETAESNVDRNADRKNAQSAIEKFHTFDTRAKKILNSTFEFLNLPAIYENVDETTSSFIDTNKRTKVGVLLQKSKWPTSSGYIRIISPLTTDYAQNKIELVLLDSAEDQKLESCDVVIVQRVAIDNDAKAKAFIDKVKSKGIRLFVDLDDAFALIPDSHPEKDKYRKLDTTLRYLMNNAELTMFSTHALCDVYKSECANAAVVPNSLDPRLWRNYRKPPLFALSNRKQSFVYMGTATHEEDFNFILPALDKLAKKYHDQFTVTIIGAVKNPPVRAWLKVVKPPANANNYPKFVKWFSSLDDFTVGLSPLIDNQFNNCKSDIKFLDYSALGILSVLPDLAPYKSAIKNKLAIGAENTVDGWFHALKLIMDGSVNHEEIAKKSYEELWETRSTLNTNCSLINSILPKNVPSKRIDSGIEMIPGAKVMQGKHGWLFLDNDNNRSVDQFTGKRLIDNKPLSDWGDYLKKINQFSKELDFKYAVLIAPAKEYIFPEFYPYDKADITPIDQLLELHSSDNNLIWPLSSLKSHREFSYWKGDSHWSDYGALVAMTEVLRHFDFETDELVKLSNFNISELVGDLGNKFIQPKSYPVVTSADKLETIVLSFNNFVSNHGRIWVYEPEFSDRLLTSCVFFGDSFAVNCVQFLAKFFKRIVFVHTAAACDYSILEYEKPSHVIFQTNSRFIIYPPEINYSIIPTIDSKLKLMPPERVANIKKRLLSTSFEKNDFYSRLILDSINRT